MVKIVLDTNVFLSAMLYGGISKTIFHQVSENKLELHVSPQLRDEVLRKLNEYEADEETLRNATLFLSYRSIFSIPRVKVTVCRDPKDNFLLELAQTAQADYLITRDKDLLEIPNGVWKTTKILKPEEFLQLLRTKKLLS